MNDMMINESFEARSQKVLQVAKQLYQGNPDWVTFFREVLGVDGAARSVFADQNDYVSFEKTDAYAEIQQMVTNLRNRKIPGGSHNEATRVITVRLPESLHEALKAEASDHKTSMNKLCISKLLQVLIEDENNRAAAAARLAAQPATRPATIPVSQPVVAAMPAAMPASQPSPSTMPNHSQTPNHSSMPNPSNQGTQRFGNNY